MISSVSGGIPASTSRYIDILVQRIKRTLCVLSCSEAFPAQMTSSPEKFIFALVGLPARGKSYLSAKIVTYFNWSGVPARIFNAGSKRRVEEGATESGRSTFFSSSNKEALSRRNEIAMSTLQDAVQWLKEENGSMAIFDATNTTRERRCLIQEYLSTIGLGVKLVFIESICNDPAVLNENLLQKVRHSPDFAGLSEEAALNDLKARIGAYESVYETVSDDENAAYIKIIDLANKVICFQIWGTVCMRCAQLLMSCHTGLRPVYLARAGHCDGVDDLSQGQWLTNVAMNDSPSGAGVLGPYSRPEPTMSSPVAAYRERADSNSKMPSSMTCNASLSESGKTFAKKFAKYIKQQGHSEDLTPLSSTMTRAFQTAGYLGIKEESILQFSSLGILDTGILHGLSVKYIQSFMPDDYAEWERDPLHYRFPGGESILDMNKRLAEVVLEIERIRTPVAVVSHLSTIQSLVAYFTARSPSKIPHIVVPRHSIIVLQPSIYGWSMKTIPETDLPDL